MSVIRQATVEDVEGILPLMQQLGYPQSIEYAKERLRLYCDTPNYGFAVAEQSNQIVGWVAWSCTHIFVFNKVRIHIEGLIIDAKYRGCGIGKQLIAYVEDYAHSLGPSIIDLVSGLRRANDGTHAFYKNLGYHNEGYMAKLYLRKELQ